jgi:flagellin-like protein
LSNKKGVSEIVATVLMIMIVTLIGFTVLLYGMGYFSGTTSARDQANAITIAGLEERFIIVDSNFIRSGGNTIVAVTVYNYGQTNVDITAIYLNSTASLSNIASTVIYPNTIQQINGTYIGIIPYNNSQDIRVVSTLGNYYENYYTS